MPTPIGYLNLLTDFYIAGHVAFFGFISEMKTPTDYPKTLYLLQITDTSMYVIAAVVIYIYGGKDVASPALSSTKPITAKLAYGIAIPTVRYIRQMSLFHIKGS